MLRGIPRCMRTRRRMGYQALVAGEGLQHSVEDRCAAEIDVGAFGRRHGLGLVPGEAGAIAVAEVDHVPIIKPRVDPWVVAHGHSSLISNVHGCWIVRRAAEVALGATQAGIEAAERLIHTATPAAPFQEDSKRQRAGPAARLEVVHGPRAVEAEASGASEALRQ